MHAGPFLPLTRESPGAGHPTSFTSAPHCCSPNPGLTICHLGCKTSLLPNQLAASCPPSSRHTAAKQSFLRHKSNHSPLLLEALWVSQG